jgi:hypothetical protein
MKPSRTARSAGALGVIRSARPHLATAVVAVVAGLFGGLTGCASTEAHPKTAAHVTAPPPAPPVNDPDARKADFLSANPNARVGQILAVDSAQQFASVGDLPIKDFQPGDPITFIVGKDQGKDQYVNGRVVEIVNDNVLVKYDTAMANGHQPQVGDLAVRVVQGPPHAASSDTG